MSDMQKTRAGLSTARDRKKEQSLLSTPISGAEFGRRYKEAAERNRLQLEAKGPLPAPISGEEFARRLGTALRTGTARTPVQPEIVTPATEAAAPALQIVGETGSLGLSKTRKSSRRKGAAATLLGSVGGAAERFGE